MKNESKRVPWNKGLTKETDARVKKNSDALKGHKCWSKGLTKETDERVRKLSESLKGQKQWNEGLTKETDERVRKMAEKKIGKKPWNYGVHKHEIGVPYETPRDHYVKVLTPDKRSMHYHRWLVECAIGRKLERHEDVDHIDDDKRNNDLSNLQVLTRRNHSKKHRGLKYDYIWRQS